MRFERIDNLLLMERIAAGGMAEVFRGKQFGASGFEKTVAIKRILPTFTANKEFKSMFQAEANLSAQLEHPNIVHIYANGEHEDYLYLVMEFVEGKNIRDLTEKVKSLGQLVPHSVICYIVAEAAKGLDYAHNFHDEKNQPLNIVHRDVNHQNILISIQGNVKIVDFGVAKAAATSESTRAGVLKGKLAYMSPEQAMGKAIDGRSDIFSLGVVMWELLTGISLFADQDEVSTLDKVRKCIIKPPSHIRANIDPDLEKITMKALSKNPDERYLSAKHFLVDIQAHLNQKYPNATSVEIAKYIQSVYEKEIAADKAKRNKINDEARAYVQKSNEKKKEAEAEKSKLEAIAKTGTLKFSRPKEEKLPEKIGIKFDLQVSKPSFSSMNSGISQDLAKAEELSKIKAIYDQKRKINWKMISLISVAIGLAIAVYFLI